MARVAVDMPLPHLDRFFDYAVPAELSEAAVPGCRVRVRFAGRQRDGFLIERVAASESDRSLSPLLKVVSSEPVLQPQIVTVIRAVADHYAGTFADVVRLAVPPRHGLTEKAAPAEHPAIAGSAECTVLSQYPHGESFAAALEAGRGPRAALSLTPVHASVGDWAGALVDAAAATLAGGRGVLLLVPDAADLTRLATRCEAAFGRGSFVTLSAELGPAARYRAFLAASRARVRLVLGTRAAAFAPVPDLGLIALYDDGDDSWAEPRAPYPHARVVAATRAAQQGCGLLFVGYGRTAETQALVQREWLVSLEAPAHRRREASPVVRVAASTDLAVERDPAAHSRLPHEVFSAIRAGLARGPVLVQVPRAGYLPALACAQCRAIARCPACAHPLAAQSSHDGALVICTVCGVRPDWHCPECGASELRAPRVGVVRTAEELGRAFPQTLVVQSSGEHRVDEVGAEPALVLATPGAEPRAADGYAAAVLLDADLLLARADLRAGEEALRRWLAAVALVRPAGSDGTVVLVGDGRARAVQALVRLDPVGFAQRELADRVEAGFPPATRLVSLDGPAEPVAEVVRIIGEQLAVEVLGPAPSGEGEVRAMFRVPVAQGRPLVAAAKTAQAQRTAHKAEGTLRVRVDPAVL